MSEETHKKTDSEKSGMSKNTLIAIVLGVLVVVAVVQAFQLTTLDNSLSGASVVKTKTANTPTAQAGGGAELPSSLQNLPSMVGGC